MSQFWNNNVDFAVLPVLPTGKYRQKTGLNSMLALSFVTISENTTKGIDIDWGDEKVTLRD